MFARKVKEEKEVLTDAASGKGLIIDVGLHSIKCAHLEKGLLHLQEYPVFEHPKDTSSLDPLELADSQMDAIRRAIHTVDAKAEIILSPPPSLEVLTRILQPQQQTDLPELIEKELPFQLEKLAIDIQPLHPALTEESPRPIKKSPRYVLAAAALDYVHKSIGLLGEFQLQIKSLTPAPVGLLNYILRSNKGREDRPIVLLDLGQSYSYLIVFRQRDQFLVRTLELGGTHLNLEMMKNLNVDFETAEKIKLERILIDDLLFDSKGTTKAIAMFQAINGWLCNLVDETKRSMTFFEDFFITDISKAVVILAGGTSALKNLDRYLGKELGLPVKRIGDALYNLAPDSPFGPQFASTVGLLRENSDPDLLGINLLNNVEGMLFKLQEGDFYLTGEGFISKKKYRRIQKEKTKEHLVRTGPTPAAEQRPPFPVLGLIKELPEKVRSTFKGEKKNRKFSFQQARTASVKEQVKHLLVMLGALFLVSAALHQFVWSPKMKRLHRTIDTYLLKSTELEGLRWKIPLDQETQVYTVSATDKMLWTPKLRAIASALPEKVWISDLEIEGSHDKGQGRDPVNRALTIACHVSSDKDDHLALIARFINNLKAQQDFIKDFTAVNFHSAARRPQQSDTLDFSLTFPLNRRLIEQRLETLVREKR